MKIAVNSRIYQEKYSGIQNYIFNLYSRVIILDAKNSYIFLQSNEKKTIGETIIMNVFPGNFGKAMFDWIFTLFFLWKIHPGLFHGPAFILPLFRSKSCKYVVTIHDLAFLVYPENYPWIFRKYMYFAMHNSINNADKIISISESTRSDLLRYYPSLDPEKIITIPLGVSEDFFKKTNQGRVILDNYFFSVTTHPKRKNILRILDILYENKKELTSLKYVIVGLLSGYMLEELKKKIEMLELEETVILFGYATPEELNNLYSNAEFFIYPSYYEGFGLPILEAMASGCLVISSNNSSLPEVNPNKNCQFDPQDNASIYSRIQYMIQLSENEKRLLKDENIAFARGFTWGKTAYKTIEVFNTLS